MVWITKACLGLAILLVLLASPVYGDGNVSSSETPVRISNVSFVAPSPERANLNEEWVKIENIGKIDVDLTGWSISDEQEHTYVFPDGFILRSGASVKVHTGTGNNTQEDLYWGRSVPVWNNDGDSATLRDSSGSIIDSKP
ncbi:competence-like protein [Methanothrix thermoacetophila PT]|jgi:Intermediate filament tail domain.|uniref:Competence-like protein n=1 Tax=Methanothrix thermoacetophila (strain DSM 6194 / JCM 14653 / NBRC 101360 / PT) TaxID=349307 RepID=A0B6S3_METTP|nr:competence-like protein [Methanothrix thermoacetophila PT]